MNDLKIDQISTLLNTVVSQATGRTDLAGYDATKLIAVAQTSLLSGYDPLINAVSQVLSRTIFSIRPYYAKFRGLNVDTIQFGNHVRKLAVADQPSKNDERLPLTDDTAVDMYKVKKPKVLQTNFYGQSTWQRHITLFKDQLDTAFRSAQEFGNFVSMVTQNAADVMEQERETLSRTCIGNMIGALNAVGDTRVIHLLTEYNTLTGGSLTAQTVYLPDNYKAFIQWLYSRIMVLSDMFEERTSLYQTEITGYNINRHTPKRRQRLYLYSPLRYKIASSVLSNTFHDTYLTMGDFETVSFWQSPKDGDTDKVTVTPSYIGSTGELQTGSEQSVENVMGILTDVEALGTTNINSWSGATPFNVAGGYTNIFYHNTARYWNDLTEKSVLLLLD